VGGFTFFRRRREVGVSALVGGSLLENEFGLVSLVMEEETELCRLPCVELRRLLLFVSLLAGDSSGAMLKSGIMVIFPSASIRFAPCLGVCNVVEFRLFLLELEGVFFADIVSRSRLGLGLGLLCWLLVPLFFKLASCSDEGVQEGDEGIPEEVPSCRSALESRLCLLLPPLLPLFTLCSDPSGQEVLESRLCLLLPPLLPLFALCSDPSGQESRLFLLLCSDPSGQEVDGWIIPSSRSALEDRDRLWLLPLLLPTLGLVAEGIPVEEDDRRPGLGLFREVVLGALLLLFRTILSSFESEARGQEGNTGTLEGLSTNSFGV
jgi:hypothetical protein